MVLLHKRDWKCCHISANPITVCVWSCIWFVDATVRIKFSIFSEEKSKHTYLIFMWKLNIHQNILFLMLLYSSKKLHKKPSQKGKGKIYIWPVLEICRLILLSKWNYNWSWHISLPMKKHFLILHWKALTGTNWEAHFACMGRTQASLDEIIDLRFTRSQTSSVILPGFKVYWKDVFLLNHWWLFKRIQALWIVFSLYTEIDIL